MKTYLLCAFAKLVLGREGRVFFTRDYQSFSVVDDKWIVINPYEGEPDDDFIAHIREQHGFKRANEISLPVWTILHEIGHIRTDDFVESNDEMRTILQMCYDYGGDYKKINSMYYDLPDEWEATEWAIQFVKRHFRLCQLISRI